MAKEGLNAVTVNAVTEGDVTVQNNTKVLQKLHLVTDAGFVRSTILWLIFDLVLLSGAYAHGPLRLWAMDLYEEIKLKMLGVAHRMAWWSLLGLLSSSCCVLQIILNSFSFGCAGFNTLLGPLRPPCIAFTLIAQSITWYVAYPLPFQWAPTAATTAVSLLLTFTPELLYAAETRHVRRREGADDARTVARLAFTPKAMGCLSCLSSVRRMLQAQHGVVGSVVSLERASACVLLNAEGAAADLLASHIVAQVVAGGFPASLVSLTPAAPADIAAVKAEACAHSCNTQAGGCNKQASELQALDSSAGRLWESWLPWVQCVVGGLLGSSCCLIQLGANVLASFNLLQIGTLNLLASLVQ
jgi:hypothetical protein